jgi:glycosidase
MKLSSLALLLPFFAAVPLACATADEFGRPPGGTGGFDPSGSGGHNSSASSSGSTTSGGGQGGAGGMDIGHPKCDDSLKLCDHVFTYADKGETSVEVRGDFAADGWTAGVAMTKSGSTWTATVPVPWNTPVQYKLVLNGSNWITDPANPTMVPDGFGGNNSEIMGATCDTWTCAPPLMGTFDWRDAVLYFVFVDRFLDGNPANNGGVTPGVQKPADYQGGDWAGVKQKIDAGYFTDLGVNVLWLTVPVDNTSDPGVGSDGHQYSGYHGYWPSNLDKPEEHFGTLADLQALVASAHAKGIKVVLDYAMNHVHKSSPIYSQHNDWFWPLDINGQSCVCGSNACAWDGPNAKRCWFTDYLPDFNFTNQAARDFSVNNAVQWIKDAGIDGFRLDAVKHIEDQWILDLRKRVKAEIEPMTKEHFWMVGETFTGDKNLIKYYVDPANLLDGQFDFPLRIQLTQNVLMRHGSMQDLDGFLNANDNYYGAGIMSTFIGNHDIPRAIHFAEDNPLWGSEWADGKDRAWNNSPGQVGGTNAYERLGNAFTILFTTKGVPLIYYGDEYGMAGAGDPDNRRPMQWSNYSAGQTKLHDHIKKLTTIRAAHAALRRGNRKGVFSSGDVIVYQATQGADTVYVAVNRGDSAQQAQSLPAMQLKDELNGGMVTGPSVSIPPRSALILTP